MFPWLPTALRLSSDQAASQLAEQCAIFCDRVTLCYSRADQYVLRTLCHQVIGQAGIQVLFTDTVCFSDSQVSSVLQLVWHSDANTDLKAGVCGAMSLAMGMYAATRINKVHHL